jgi:phenylacetate-CoA ligase
MHATPNPMSTRRLSNSDLSKAGRDQLRRHQDRRLRKLLEQVLKSNRFFRARLLSAGVRRPVPIAHLSDLPLTTKAELVKNHQENPPFGTNLTFPLENYTRLHQTSGTTGQPMRWLDTPESWQSYLDQWQCVYTGAGVRRGDRVFVAFSFGPFIGFWGAFDAAHQMGCLAITGGGQTTEQRLHMLRDTHPTVLVSTPTYALRLAEVAHSLGIDTRTLGIRTTIHAGEPGAGIPSTRARIQELWNAKAFDHCGMTEAGAVGFECRCQLGPHVNESEFILEILDPQTCQPVGEGVRGEVVLTTLGRVGSPLIRYRTGDLAEASWKRCRCGRTFALLRGGLLGRADDMITVRGINVFPSSIENILRRFPEVVEFQGEVVVEREMSELLLRLETNLLTPDQQQQLADRVTGAIRAGIHLRPTVHFAAPGSLPRAEMKSRRFQTAPKE